MKYRYNNKTLVVRASCPHKLYLTQAKLAVSNVLCKNLPHFAARGTSVKGTQIDLSLVNKNCNSIFQPFCGGFSISTTLPFTKKRISLTSNKEKVSNPIGPLVVGFPQVISLPF
jgi:hypothetical protein